MPKSVPNVRDANGSPGSKPGASLIDKRLDECYRTYRENYRELVGYAYTLVGSTEAAQDIVQQAFTNTLSAIGGGSEIHSMGGFIYRCVRNLSISHIAREPDSTLIDDDLLPTQRSAASIAEERGHWRRVQETIDTLPSAQRSAFLLAEVNGLRYEEIANALGRSTNSVRQLLNRARGKIRAKSNIGSDWAGTPVPILGTDRVLESWHPALGTNVSDGIQAKIAQFQAWLGNVFQGGMETVLHPTASVAAGAAIVALTSASPAPPATQELDRAAPAASLTAAPAPSSLRPSTDLTGGQIDVAARVLVKAPTPSEAIDLEGTGPRGASTVQSEPTDTPMNERVDAQIVVASVPGGVQGPASVPDSPTATPGIDEDIYVKGVNPCCELSGDNKSPAVSPGYQMPTDERTDEGTRSPVEEDEEQDSDPCPDEGNPQDSNINLGNRNILSYDPPNTDEDVCPA